MSMDFTRRELEDAHLIVVVDEVGLFKWSSKRPNADAAAVLRAVADDIEQSDETIQEKH